MASGSPCAYGGKWGGEGVENGKRGERAVVFVERDCQVVGLFLSLRYGRRVNTSFLLGSKRVLLLSTVRV